VEQEVKVAGDGPRITVLLVDDHQLIREGLRRAFDRAGDLEVVGEAASVATAVDALDRLSPDVLVTDVKLPDGDGIALAQRARQSDPELGIVVLTMYAGDDKLFAALDSGASAFVGKDAPAEEVVAAARHAAASPRAFTARDLADAMQRRMHAPTGPKLSPREGEVLELLVDGLVISQIARRLFISESTAKTHVANIYEKLGAGNRAQAVMAAVRLGLVREAGPGEPAAGRR
jgi:DNA-binding NarL/FixJ family response regulator